jgi:hypothetical protein
MNPEQFRRTVELAVVYHDEAERCADVGAYHAACLMIAAAAEAALLATATLHRDELVAQGSWPFQGDVPRPPERLGLAELCKLARDAGWLPALGEGELRDPSDSEVGDPVEFVRWLRNVAAHPGRLVREDPRLKMDEPAYRNAYGVVRAVFDHTHTVIQALD